MRSILFEVWGYSQSLLVIKNTILLKITMLNDHIPKGVVHKSFRKFSVSQSLSQFQCVLGTSAPTNDLEFVKQLDKYRSID